GRTITASDGDGAAAERLTGLIEIDAGVQPGDSGGPLLDSNKRVIGMNTAASASFHFQDVAARDAYAIPIGNAVRIATAIKAGKGSATIHIGATPFLGIEVQNGSSDGTGGSGAVIADVVPNGPADRAGLQSGDTITAINGQAVSTA